MNYFWISPVSDDRIVNNHWHFICITWNGLKGNVKFYYEGIRQDTTAVSGPMTHLSPHGKFSIGVTKDPNSGGTYSSSFVGKLSCVNIWSYLQSDVSIIAMASGTMNINGDYLAWRDVQGYIVGNLTVVFSTNIYWPGNILSLSNLTNMLTTCIFQLSRPFNGTL
jgi:hypothetical protein